MKHLFPFPCRLVSIVLLCLFSLSSVAQRTQANAFDDYVFWGYPNAYLNSQAQMAYPLINSMLQAYPPAVEMDKHRQMTFATLDQFLHEADYNKRDAFYSFVNARMSAMLSSIDEPVIAGVRIYKVYNSGVILKTLNTTIAIDFIPGGEAYKPFISDSVINEIAGRCNALLITNTDALYANRNVAKAFVDAGKKVYVPKRTWTDLGEQIITIGADTIQDIELSGMTLHVLPGHNNNNRTNIYVMDFHGRGVVAHTGTQEIDTNLSWAEDIHKRYSVDVLLTKSQTTQMETILSDIKPRMVITTQENEMKSSIDRRESYWTTQKRLKSLAELNIPNVIMTWGEKYDYADNASANISPDATKVMIDGTLYIERKGSLYSPAGIKVK